MDTKEFNFSYPIQMRWNDMDALGHVNNATFVTYFEVARGLFMPTVCKGWDWQKDMFLLANVNVDFIKELRIDAQNVNVLMRTNKIGNKSFELSYAITSKKGNETILHATGSTTQIMFDMKTRTTIEIPNWVRESLTNYDA